MNSKTRAKPSGPPRRTHGGSLRGLGAWSEDQNIPLSSLRAAVHRGDLVPDDRGLFAAADVLAYVAEHPDEVRHAG